jgi:dolichyl-phosphate beta-glucosyltransferase
MSLSIVIPAYNEEKIIESTIKKVQTFGVDELIVVDDGSKDNTVDIISKHNLILLRNKINQGKGSAVKKGILAAKSDFILFMDADSSIDISNLNKFLPFIKKYDIIIGVKKRLGQSKLRRFLGKSFNTSMKLLIGLSSKDTQCGFKLFTKKAAKDIFSRQKIKGFAFDVELLLIAKKLGYKVKEIPIVIDNSSKSTISFLDPIKMLKDMIIIRLNELKGYYK